MNLFLRIILVPVKIAGWVLVALYIWARFICAIFLVLICESDRAHALAEGTFESADIQFDKIYKWGCPRKGME